MMKEKKLEIVCPCCETRLKVDSRTGEIIWEERKEKDLKSLSDLVKGLDAQKKEKESLFKRQSETFKERNRILEEKFKEAQKKVDKSTDKPIRDFDLD